ncbi:MAG: twin-arginine translocase subunit TatC [Candidatus Nanopelagicales bacterium]|nr:twin-arginine translocase subunit TatC [Actinomycetota bacterium]MBT5182412.1 twin-arginine translocase subunit TatC [Actinomycetota bacterium]MBT5502382.1 twin-arginine translocase subunit TatC [Actinomycetota bacterium]MBT5806310.1 twin-arginine translocase subunit TatC [Actinomycetota bacterium]MDB0039356.1 twin-arginine translocase subunit TatC [Actinomycetota bacterium]
MALREKQESAAMPLTAHLRELRSRLFKSGIAIVIGMVIGWVYYAEIFIWLSKPFTDVIAAATDSGQDVTLALTGVADPFVLQIQVSAVAGLALSAPVWLYQLWRFVTPGLHRNERRWAIGFAAVASPLFAAGITLAYLVLPFGLEILLGFTPENVENIVSVDKYLSFFLRTILVFGVGFLTPLLIVLLNFAGILSGKRLLSWWRWIIFTVFIFSAVATPTGDPINLLLLATPILALVVVAVGISLLNDRRRARKSPDTDFSKLEDDEISPLEPDSI